MHDIMPQGDDLRPFEAFKHLLDRYVEAKESHRNVAEAMGIYLENLAVLHCAELLTSIHRSGGRVETLVKDNNVSHLRSLKDIEASLKLLYAPMVDNHDPQRLARLPDVMQLGAHMDTCVAEMRQVATDNAREVAALNQLCTQISKQISSLQNRPSVEPAIDDEALVQAVAVVTSKQTDEFMKIHAFETGKAKARDTEIRERLLSIRAAIAAVGDEVETVRKECVLARDRPPHMSPKSSPKPAADTDQSLHSEELFEPKQKALPPPPPPSEGGPSDDDDSGRKPDRPLSRADPRRSPSASVPPADPPGNQYLPKVKDMPTYSGNTREDIDEWISRISTFYEQMGVDENKVVPLLPVLLKDYAFTWMSRLPRDYR